MLSRKLYIFVEGNDDSLFFSSLVVPVILNKYDAVEIIQYAQMKRDKVNRFLDAIVAFGADYLVIADMDDEINIQHKKRKIQSNFSNVLLNKIIVVITEIESWFISGLSNEKTLEWGISSFDRTELVTKEIFNKLYGRKFHSRLDFMQELIKYYDYELASKKNISFNFFYDTYMK